MNNSTLASLMQNTYVHSDFVYRISLLSEFFDFVFFTDHDSVITKDIIGRFAISRKEPPKDIDFLESLPQTFMDMFTRDSFRKVLSNLSNELQQLQIISLTLPVVFSSEHTEAIGKWVRETIGSNVILDISVDASISVGCQFVWENIMHDFSIEHYLELHKDDLNTRLTLSKPFEVHA